MTGIEQKPEHSGRARNDSDPGKILIQLVIAEITIWIGLIDGRHIERNNGLIVPIGFVSIIVRYLSGMTAVQNKQAAAAWIVGAIAARAFYHAL